MKFSIYLFFFIVSGLENPVNIDFGKERSSLNDAWEMEWPLKVIVHGWLTSSKKEIGMFSVKTGRIQKINIFIYLIR